MNRNLKGRDWLMTQDWSVEELELALDTADQLKADFKAGKPTLHLAHKTAFLIFFDKSTRTRNSLVDYLRPSTSVSAWPWIGWMPLDIPTRMVIKPMRHDRIGRGEIGSPTPSTGTCHSTSLRLSNSPVTFYPTPHPIRFSRLVFIEIT